jgi:hypothetical protein
MKKGFCITQFFAQPLTMHEMQTPFPLFNLVLHGTQERLTLNNVHLNQTYHYLPIVTLMLDMHLDLTFVKEHHLVIHPVMPL